MTSWRCGFKERCRNASVHLPLFVLMPSERDGPTLMSRVAPHTSQLQPYPLTVTSPHEQRQPEWVHNRSRRFTISSDMRSRGSPLHAPWCGGDGATGDRGPSLWLRVQEGVRSSSRRTTRASDWRGGPTRAEGGRTRRTRRIDEREKERPRKESRDSVRSAARGVRLVVCSRGCRSWTGHRSRSLLKCSVHCSG